MFTNMTYIISCGVLKLHISDHFPIFVKKKKTKDEVYNIITHSNYKNYNSDTFGDLLEGHLRWAVFWEPDKTPDKLWSIMLHIFKSVADVLYPSR